jgi:hypothetical protein
MSEPTSEEIEAARLIALLSPTAVEVAVGSGLSFAAALDAMVAAARSLIATEARPPSS